jgi:3-phenylpropionate/cinnamic acid dioxygenase small subunit
MSTVSKLDTSWGYIAAATVLVLSLALFAVQDGRTAAADELSLQDRVRQLEDEKQIRDLMTRYGQLLDASDFAGYSQLFAREGEWSGLLSGYTTIKGPENIRAAMQKNFADRKYDPQNITNLHLLSNFKIDLDGDRATGYSRWTVLSRNEKSEPYVRLSGRYEDVFVRENGRWKFQSRIARREIP